jgi:UDPglucose 6-dehydrogenase
VAVVGLGKLGAPLAAVLASKGNDVVGVDVDPEAVRLLEAGRAPVEEPGLQELVTAALSRLTASTDPTDVAGCEVVIMLVPTPSDGRGGFSNTFLLDALRQIGPTLGQSGAYPVVVVASTVMPGSCDGEVRQALEETSGLQVGVSVGLCYSPEFIALGNVIRDMLEPDMVLIGESDARAGDRLQQLYSGVVENEPPFRRMSLVNAELTKIAVNTYVTMKISYANTLADMCERLPGADVEPVTEALGLDSRIGGKYLRGAIAYGGPCFPRDNKAFALLARDLGTEAPLAEATDTINEAQGMRLARIVRSHLHADDAVGILGLSYKPDTAVAEESPGVALAEILADGDEREVNVFDPRATAAASRLAGRVRTCSSATELLERSDVVVITTPWKEFASLAVDRLGKRQRRPVVIDCWRVLAEGSHGDAVKIVRLGQPLTTVPSEHRGGTVDVEHD